MSDRHRTVRLGALLVGILLALAPLSALMPAQRAAAGSVVVTPAPTATPEPTLSPEAVVKLAELEAFVQAQLDAPGTFTGTEMTSILQAIDVWDEEFAHDFCLATRLCDPLIDKFEQSMVGVVAEVCSRGLGALNDGSFVGASLWVTRLVDVLRQFDILGRRQPTIGLECIHVLLQRGIELAAELAEADPSTIILRFLYDIGGSAEILGVPDIGTLATSALHHIIESILTLGPITCEADPDQGEELLRRGFIFDQSTLDGLRFGLFQDLADAIAGCGFTIDPAHAHVTFDERRLFRALRRGVPDSAVTWELLDPDGGSIDPSGQFTGGHVSGDYRIKATSTELPQFAVVTVTIDVIVIKVEPSCVTLAPGESQAFAATVTGTDEQDVIWSASGGTIDPEFGTFVAGDAAGTFEVRATSAIDRDRSGTGIVTIGASGGGEVSIDCQPLPPPRFGGIAWATSSCSPIVYRFATDDPNKPTEHTGIEAVEPTPCRQWEVPMPEGRRSWQYQDKKTYTAETSTGEEVSLDFAASTTFAADLDASGAFRSATITIDVASGARTAGTADVGQDYTLDFGTHSPALVISGSGSIEGDGDELAGSSIAVDLYLECSGAQGPAANRKFEFTLFGFGGLDNRPGAVRQMSDAGAIDGRISTGAGGCTMRVKASVKSSFYREGADDHATRGRAKLTLTLTADAGPPDLAGIGRDGLLTSDMAFSATAEQPWLADVADILPRRR